MVCQDSSSSADTICSHQEVDDGGSRRPPLGTTNPSSLLVHIMYNDHDIGEHSRTPFTGVLSSMTSRVILNIVPDGSQAARGGEQEEQEISSPVTISPERMTLVTAASMARSSSSRIPKLPVLMQPQGLAAHNDVEPCLMTPPPATTSPTSSSSSTNNHPSCCGTRTTPARVHNDRLTVLNVIEEALDLLDDFDDFYGGGWCPQGRSLGGLLQSSPPVRAAGSTSRIRHFQDNQENGRFKRYRADHEYQ